MGTKLSLREALPIIATLIILFFFLKSLSRRDELELAKLEAEKELQEAGIRKEDLEKDIKSAANKLSYYPEKARNLKIIAENAALIA